MSNLYYKKDIHKSTEGLLYGLFVYQYLLDTSTFGLMIRCLVQDQILSLKSKAPTLRIALYTVFAAAFLAFLRHLRTPDRYAVIIDFVGNVSTPSRIKLLWLDLIIVGLQVSEALIVFQCLKAEDQTRSSTSRRASHPPPTRVGQTPATRADARRSSNLQSLVRSAGTASASQSTQRGMPSEMREGSQSLTSTSTSRINTPASHPTDRHTAGASSSSSLSGSSTPLFEYTPPQEDGQEESHLNDVYNDDEEVRHSLESNPRRRSQRSEDTGSSEENEDESSEDSDDSLDQDYEEILREETFILQLRFRSMLSYLFSSQEALSLPRLPDAGSAAANAEAARVQNLPV